MSEIIIKRIKDGGELIAFIPNAPANKGMVLSYMHVGQHGEAAIDFMLNDCEAVNEDDQEPLKSELKAIGYKA